MSKLHLMLGVAALAAVLATAERVAAQQQPQVTYGPAIVVGTTDAPPGTPLPCTPVCTKKICVAEPKKNTKVVYDEVCKDYCRRTCHFSLFGLFGHGCGSCCDNGCDSCCECGKPHVKHVLVKRNRPDCDTTNCVVKEVLVEGCSPCCTPCGSPCGMPCGTPAYVMPGGTPAPAPAGELMPAPKK